MKEYVPGTRAYAVWLARNHPEEAAQARKEARRRKTLKRHGITPEHYASMLKKQNGVCAICENEERRISRSGEIQPLVVDHNHRTGEVRSLLCHDCNVAIGFIEENPAIALAMVSYLTKWGGSNRRR